MKNLLLMALIVIGVFSGCGTVSETPADSLVPEIAGGFPEGYTDFDEDVRQEAYRYFGDIFFIDPVSGEKSRLPQELAGQFQDVIGGNVLGFRKLDESRYRADAVLFLEDGAVQYGFEFGGSDNGEIVDFLEVEKTPLQFSKPEEIASEQSPTGKYRLVVEKRLIAVDYYTVDEVNVPAFVGRYDMWLESDAGRQLVDFSFDRFSANNPFEIRGFAKEEQYLEYFEWDFVRFFNVYDIAAGEQTNIGVSGRLENAFWVGDKYVLCSAGGVGLMPSVTVVEPPGWKLFEQEFVYPAAINGTDFQSEGEVWDALNEFYGGQRDEAVYCELDGTTLFYSDVDGGRNQVEI